MKILSFTIVILLAWSCHLVQTYKILMLLPFGSRSHKNVFDPVAEVLAQKGHEITIMAPLKDIAEIKGVRNVHLQLVDAALNSQGVNFFQGTFDDEDFVDMMLKTIINMCNATFHEPEILEIVKAGHGSKKYDIVVVDQSFNDYVLPLGHLMGVPNVYLSTVFLLPSVAWSLNVPSPYSYLPTGFYVVGDPMSFTERAINVFTALWFIHLFHGTMFPRFESVIKEYIPDSRPLLELEKNVSLVLVNTNPAIHTRRPTMPNVIEVGCLHCKESRALPKDLEDFMQESKDDGVVYFSLGSVTKGTYMPEDMKKKVIEVFSKIPQKVLWKYEEDIPDLPKNVKLIKWAPQQDILGHPKVRLFISHGGGLSTQEAPYHGCPLLGFPLSADQIGNMGNALRLGYAEFLDWKTFSAKELLDTVSKMLKDPRYKEKASQLSERLKDYPQLPAERAAYWIEYAIRHQGAPHLKSAAQDLCFFQYFLLDVIGVAVVILVLLLIIIAFVIKKLVKLTLRLVRNQNKVGKTKKDKKTN